MSKDEVVIFGLFGGLYIALIIIQLVAQYKMRNTERPVTTSSFVPIDPEKKRWLQSRLAEAAFLTFIITACLLMFGGAGKELSNELNYIAYLFGLSLGIVFISNGFPNPVSLSFVMQHKNLIMDEEQVETYLKPVWKKMPRIYLWLASIPFSILPLLLWHLPANQPGSQLVVSLITGFISGVALSICVSCLFLFFQLRKANT